MEIRVKRLWPKEDYTVGRLYLDGVLICNTLEDKVRDLSKEKKVYGKTAIPSGTYRVSVTYSPKFKRDLPYLHGVPFFEGIRIHSGNTADDSLGCILVGDNTKKGWLSNSRKREKEITEALKTAQAKGEILLLTID